MKANSLKNIIIILKILVVFVLHTILSIRSANAVGPYLESAHGSSSYGVKRSSTPDYPKGHCAHCHEAHAGIGGNEPAPVGGPMDYTLFYYNYVNQTDGFCFECHNTTTYQETSFNNYSYSYRAGGDSTTCPDTILSAFSFIDETGNPVLNCGSSSGSSHKLTDIKSFITGKWGYTADSNPCAACHDPHRAKKDPHTSGSRGWPVSRPSGHADTSTWELYGDDATEKMSNYSVNYQAPYQNKTLSTYEPDGSATQDGSNLTNYVTFCTDCHTNVVNSIYSNALGRYLKPIDWNVEKHGKGNADVSLCGNDPYPSGSSGLGKVLSCTDCHEPHGSTNAFLTRNKVNGDVLDGNIGSFSTTDWHYLCDSCHKDDKEINTNCQEDHWFISHHSNQGCNSDRPYNPSNCSKCHSGSGGSNSPSCYNMNRSKLICTNCHYHGSSVTDADYSPTTRRTF